MSHPFLPEADRRAQLCAAEARGMALFDAIEARGPDPRGQERKQLDDEIFILAKKDFGVRTIGTSAPCAPDRIRSAPFTKSRPCACSSPRTRSISDLGPVFGEWEADIGRSYALGGAPQKKKLIADLRASSIL